MAHTPKYRVVHLRNDFHATRCDVRCAPERIDRQYGALTVRVTPSQAHRAWRKLCGIEECLCSGAAGVRQSRVMVEVI